MILEKNSQSSTTKEEKERLGEEASVDVRRELFNYWPDLPSKRGLKTVRTLFGDLVPSFDWSLPGRCRGSKDTYVH